MTVNHALPMTQLLHRFLARGDALARLQDHAARLRRLQRALEAGLPPQLTAQCQVANLKDGTLTVSARGGAAAVRLRQILPSLIEHFVRAGHAVQAIRVKVAAPEQPAWRAPASERHLSPTAKASLERLAHTLPADAPLREALERLVRRSRE